MKINKPYEEMSILELFKIFIISKLPRGKEKINQEISELVNEPPPAISINHIAITLDGIVEEVIRCENRLAALLLSEPIFVEFDPEQNYPIIGITEYKDGKLETPEQDKILSESKIENLLSDLKKEEE